MDSSVVMVEIVAIGSIDVTVVIVSIVEIVATGVIGTTGVMGAMESIGLIGSIGLMGGIGEMPIWIKRLDRTIVVAEAYAVEYEGMPIIGQQRDRRTGSDCHVNSSGARVNFR